MNRIIVAASLCAAFGAGCVVDQTSSETDNLSSKDATFLQMSFEGAVVAEAADTEADRKKAVVAQLFYMAGELDKTHRGHGQFAFVELDDVTVETLDDGLERIRYSARLPVAWPKRRDVPETYRVVVPASVAPDALRVFNSTYKGSCAKGKYGEDTLWYDFKPVTTVGCEIADGDALDVVASVEVHPRITTDKRPESELFWNDGELRMVLVHGTDAASSYDPDDTGVREYDKFKDILRREYPGAVETTGESNYDIYDDWQLEVMIPKLGGGEGKLVVNTLLARSLKYAGSSFDGRFGELTKTADIVTYGGHSGLSKNIKALAAKEQVSKEHYQVWFIDGCSTFAYLDRSLVDRRIEVNGADNDPNGTKYLDVIVNAQPAPWYTGAASQWTVLSALAATEHTTFMDIMDDLGPSATPAVSGEEDNPSIDSPDGSP